MNVNVLRSSCSPTYGANNSPDELQDIRRLLPMAAGYARVPPEFFFAIMMQESDGCVRVGSTASAVTNPGLMQSNAGGGSCFNTSPCPAEEIKQMLMDGAGEKSDFGLKQALQLFQNESQPAKYFKAARAYNAGPHGVNPNQLELGGATRCYASDIANRLLGWVNRANSTCPFDGHAATTVPAGSGAAVPSTNSTLTESCPALPTCSLYHYVEDGDTCDKVAEAYGTTFAALRKINNIDEGCTNLWKGYCYCVKV
jgi:hypothetical protein